MAVLFSPYRSTFGFTAISLMLFVVGLGYLLCVTPARFIASRLLGFCSLILNGLTCSGRLLERLTAVGLHRQGIVLN
jgi:hypothetical protein